MGATKFPDEFVPNIQATDYYRKWEAANKNGDAPKWRTFRDAVLAYSKGDSPVAIPAMATKYGKALVAAGKDSMSVTDIGSVIPPAPPSGVRPPLPPGAWRGAQTITSGGIYDDAWETTGSTPCVTVNTTQPVTLRGWMRNLDGAPLIQCTYGMGVNVTVEDVYGYQAAPYTSSGRFFIAEGGAASVTIQRCYFENSRGIDIATSNGVNIMITRNRCRNIQSHDNNPFLTGNFVQLRVMTPTSAVISWNEILNEYPGMSEPHDIVSIYYVSGVQVVDNYLYGQWRFNNEAGSSQGGITIDATGSPGSPYNVSNTYVARNQVIDGYGIVTFPTTGGSNILLENNRIISDRFLPNGQVKANGAGSPLTIRPGGTNNHAHGNLVGFIDRDNQYINGAFIVNNNYMDGVGAPHSQSQEVALNTFLPQASINSAAEQAEWAFWQNKLTTNNIVIGPGPQ